MQSLNSTHSLPAALIIVSFLGFAFRLPQILCLCPQTPWNFHFAFARRPVLCWTHESMRMGFREWPSRLCGVPRHQKGWKHCCI